MSRRPPAAPRAAAGRPGDRKQAALGAVAEHFGATLGRRAGPHSAHAVISGKRIVLDAAVIEARVSGGSGTKPPRLRFDRVVLGLITRLREALEDSVPSRHVAMVTVTAPIRLASKTGAVIEERIRALSRGRIESGRFAGTVHGNEVQVRILRAGGSSAKLAGFVHNRDSDPEILFDLADALLRRPASARRSPASSSIARWLVIAIDDGPSWTKTYRHVCEQLFVQAGYQRLLVVGRDGSVATG
jgi:hypothetical protein